MGLAKEHAIIVAGGSGQRMGRDIPKQFLPLAQVPILMHTIRAFYTYNSDIHIILVLAPAEKARWEDLVIAHQFDIPIQLAPGGSTRFHSVKNGLGLLSDATGLVAIHDGVRPLVTTDTIAASFRLAAMHGSAVASVRLKESLREIDKDFSRSVDRSRYRLIQTPQTFQLPLIREAYALTEETSATDDAGVFEAAGHRISLFEGSYTNIKITTPEDLAVAESLMK